MTNGAGPALGLGGNDLICVPRGTSPLLEVSVGARAGDDVVDAPAVTNRDLLVGGPGRDTINGNAGRDTCSSEKLRSCEIKWR